MGLLKNLISDAVNEGIGKGIQSAVGKAVESAVKPAADKLAGKAADQLNQASKDIDQSMAEARAAQGEAAAAIKESAQAAGTETADEQAAAGSGFASLGAVLSSYASAMQDAAGQVAKNMKECPQCGEVATADNKFCPKCGAPLPERTIAEGFLCRECGKQNAPGTTFCGGCGALLPAAAEEQAAQKAKWDALLPQYPKWELRGTYELDDGGEVNGCPAVSVHIHGAGRAELAKYVAALKAAGFTAFYDGDSDIYYKVVDGVCRSFDKTDADQGDFLSMTFFVGDHDKRAAERARKQAAQAKDSAKDAAKLVGDAAKGLFKKLF